MPNALDAVIVDGLPVNKADLRARARRIVFDYASFAEVRGVDLTGTTDFMVNGAAYRFDPADFTTADDGVNCIVDLAGHRYKLTASSAELEYVNPNCGDAVTYCDAAFAAILATGSQVRFRSGRNYRFKNQIVITKCVDITGSSTNEVSTPILSFDTAPTVAIDSVAKGAISFKGAGAQASRISGLRIALFSAAWGGGINDGIWHNTKVHFSDLYLVAVGGGLRDGFRADNSGNCDNSTYHRCISAGGAVNDFHATAGIDTSTHTYTQCIGFGATSRAFFDESSYGSSYYDCQAYSGITGFTSGSASLPSNTSTFTNCYCEGSVTGQAYDVSSPGIIINPRGVTTVTAGNRNTTLAAVFNAGWWSNDNINGAKNTSLAYSLGDATNSAWRLSITDGLQHHWLGTNQTITYAGYGINKNGIPLVDFYSRPGANFVIPPVLPSSTVSALPSASTSGAGSRAYVTDANATTFNAVAAGGGTNKLCVTSDGTNWRIG